MTDRPTKLIVNCSTGERTVVPLTDEEIAEREARAAQAEADRLAQEQAEADLQALKDSAKAKLVAGDPLTAEEADTLVL
jgi:hypothetical protein